MELKGSYFEGHFHPSTNSDELIEKKSPADLSRTLWSAAIDYSHIDQVIESARLGFKKWRNTSLAQRISFLEKYAQEVAKRKDQIAQAIALETGKPLWETKTEAAAVIAKVAVTINQSAARIKPKLLNEVLPGIDGHVNFKPLGVSLIIGPFNFPCHLANGQILAALLSGNSVIFKPSEKTVYSAQLLIECFHAANFPSGVINFINGSAHTTQQILQDPSVKGIFFTGSHFVGKKILESVGTDVTKLVALELGGKNTTIIHKDAHIEHSLTELVRSCFLSSGQRCTSTSMIAVHSSIADQVMNEFLEITKRIIVDHPIDFKQDPFMGPLIDKASFDQFKSYCQNARQHGAEALIPFSEPQVDFDGFYVNPTVHFLKEVSKSNPFTQQEIFAPDCVFTTYNDIEEAINIANISDYGLAASIFTQQQDIYEQALNNIDVGIFNLNRSTVGASSKLPFGGVKNSGNYHPAAVSMIDHTVSSVASLQTFDNSSKYSSIKGLS